MLKVGEKCPAGYVITTILGQSEKACVYITSDKQLRWNYTGDAPPESFVMNRFNLLMAEVKNLSPKRQRTECLVLLGKALYAALNEGSVESAVKCFDGFEVFFQSTAQQRKRARYVIVCIVVTLLMAGVALTVLHQYQLRHSLYFFGACFGAVGSCISVMQRASTIDIDWKLDNLALNLHAIVRITLGFLFGAVFVLACQSDFLLGAFKSNSKAVYLLALVAGFSERMIPDLFARLEMKQEK